MAIKADPVDSSQAGEPGVQTKTVRMDGVGDVQIHVRVSTVDDLSPTVTEDVQTLTFAHPVYSETEERWVTVTKDIDLGEKNRAAFLKAIEKYAEAGREVTSKRSTVKKTSGGSGHDTAAIRKWLKEYGHPVADQGRIPADKIELYYDKNPDAPRPV